MEVEDGSDALPRGGSVQAEENEAKRQQAAQRLKVAHDTNIALLEGKRQMFYKRERENAERRKKQAEEREAADAAKREKATQKAEQRKVCLPGHCRAMYCAPLITPATSSGIVFVLVSQVTCCETCRTCTTRR
jgi:hypothetical protein